MGIAMELASLRREFEDKDDTKLVKDIIVAIDNLQDLLDNFEE